MKDFIKVMKALSDPNRVKILKMLQRKTMCVCEMQTALGVAQPTVSNHLKILEDVGLVGYEKDGLWTNYYLADGSSTPYAATLLGNLKHWLQDEPEVVRIQGSLPGIKREDICRKRSFPSAIGLAGASDQRQGHGGRNRSFKTGHQEMAYSSELSALGCRRDNCGNL